ncbi:VOC family protein, partial [Priestia megaterium]|nr:VOC family protein [Priestia megaterium]
SKEVFEKLKEGGQIEMPLQETFWSPSYGQVTDKFGVTWQISTHIDDNE